MALSFTNLGASAAPDFSNGTDAASFASSSWSPPTSGIILLFIYSGEASGNNRVASVIGNSLTWVEIANVGWGGDVPARRLTLYATWATGATTGATTIDFGGVTQLACTAMFAQVTGAFTVSDVRDAFPQGTSAYGNSTSGTMTMLNAAASSASRCIACFSHNANEALTQRASWTSLDQLGGTGPVRGSQTQARTDAYEDTASASWTTSTQWGGIAVEINENGATTASGGSGIVEGVIGESGNFMGPFIDGNGRLYGVVEVYVQDGTSDAASDARPSVRMSPDNGLTWIEVDGFHRPHYNDLETVSVVQNGTRLHMTWQRSGDGTVFYSSFNTSDAGTNPNRWEVVDEIAGVPGTGPNEQAGTLVMLSNGTLYSFYNIGGTNQGIGYRSRSGGSWSAESTITVASKDLLQVAAVVDGSDVVHIFVVDHTTPALLYYTLTSGVLAGPTTVASGSNVASAGTRVAPIVMPPVLTSLGAYVAWLNSSDIIKGCEIISGTPGSLETVSDAAALANAGTTQSGGPVAAIARNGSTTVVLYADAAAQDPYKDVRSGGSWGTDSLVTSGVTIYLLFGTIFTRGSDIVFGYFWGDGTDTRGPDGDPLPRYAEVVVATAAAATSIGLRVRALSWLS